MLLAISSQDISSISLALVNTQTVEQCKDFLVPPEKHLRTLDSALEQWGVSLDNIKGIVIVRGPGSFTASRVSITIANTLAFVRDISVYALDNVSRIPLKELLNNMDFSSLHPSVFAIPTYDRPARITKSNV